MKNRFKSLFTLMVFGISALASTFSAEALDDIAFYLTSEDLQIEESEILTDDTIIYSEFLPDFSYKFNENTYKFYDQLNNNNKASYNAMKAWLNPTEDEIKISFPDDISYKVESTNMNKWSEEQYDEFWNMIFSNVLYGKTAFTFDYPEMFWLDESMLNVTLSNVKTSRSSSTGLYTMKISELKLKGEVKDVYGDIETASEFQQLLLDSVDEFDVLGDDRYQQVKYIHDYIAETVAYNMAAPYHDTAVGLFCEPYQIVCEGYSKALKILCDKVDIPCIVIPGNIDYESRTGHMWNYVLMDDGEWYGIDCTWDDTGSVSNPVKYTYFLKGSVSFNTTHTPDNLYDAKDFVYPELNTSNYVYNSASTTTDIITTTTPVTTIVTTTAIPETTFTTTTVVTNTKPVTQATTTTLNTITTTSLTTEITTVITTTEPVTSSHEKGDYNNDGSVNVADLLILRKIITGIDLTGDNFSYDDLNDDNVINVFDYIILSRRILGGI